MYIMNAVTDADKTAIHLKTRKLLICVHISCHIILSSTCKKNYFPDNCTYQSLMFYLILFFSLTDKQ